jgi:AraC-like DNA-binding protein
MVNYTKYLDIEIFEGTISKHTYPWHFHECFTLILVEKGKILYEFQDTRIAVTENEALIIEPFRIHRNLISQPTSYKAIFVPGKYAEGIGENPIITMKIDNPKVVSKIIDLQSILENNSTKNDNKEHICELLNLLNQSQIEPVTVRLTSLHSIPKINCGFTINELAEIEHLSKFHFQRKFKKIYGLTIGQLKQQEKAVKAKALLEKGIPATDVAYDLGFFDQSHFIKYFKKMWAVTPKHFR